MEPWQELAAADNVRIESLKYSFERRYLSSVPDAAGQRTPLRLIESVSHREDAATCRAKPAGRLVLDVAGQHFSGAGTGYGADGVQRVVWRVPGTGLRSGSGPGEFSTDLAWSREPRSDDSCEAGVVRDYFVSFWLTSPAVFSRDVSQQYEVEEQEWVETEDRNGISQGMFVPTGRHHTETAWHRHTWRLNELRGRASYPLRGGATALVVREVRPSAAGLCRVPPEPTTPARVIPIELLLNRPVRRPDMQPEVNWDFVCDPRDPNVEIIGPAGGSSQNIRASTPELYAESIRLELRVPSSYRTGRIRIMAWVDHQPRAVEASLYVTEAFSPEGCDPPRLYPVHDFELELPDWCQIGVDTWATAVNAFGDVVGVGPATAFRQYERKAAELFGTSIDGYSVEPMAINRNGLVVGTYLDADGVASGFVYSGPTLNHPAGITTTTNVSLHDVDDSGTAVGHRLQDGARTAVTWSRGIVEAIGPATGKQSSAIAIGEGGHVVGWVVGAEGQQQPFAYRDGQLDIIKVPGLLPARAVAVNRDGLVVCRVRSGKAGRSFAVVNGEVIDLGRLRGLAGLVATGVTDEGAVFGTAYGARRSVAVRWTKKHGLEDLGSIATDLGKWTLTGVVAVAPEGLVLAVAQREGTAKHVVLGGAAGPSKSA